MTGVHLHLLVNHVPILGALFRSTEFQNEQTELMFVITPRLVKPLPQQYALPTDAFTPPSAAELLSGDRFERLIGDLLVEYDHVLVDSPPILGLSDAPVISRAVEGCVLVVEAEGVAVRGIRSSMERLRMVGAHIFGVILTKVDQKSDGYGYGYGYGYGGRRYGDTGGPALDA